MKEHIRVVIVEDHPGVRAGIKKLLVNAKDIIVIGEGENGLQAIQLARLHAPDVLLLDVELPLLRGDDVVSELRDTHPQVKVLAVSSYIDRMYVQGMMDKGASGYITKDEAPELLVEAVRSVFNGDENWVSPRARKFAAPVKYDGSKRRRDDSD